MRDIRVGLAQMAPRLGDFEANLEVHLGTVGKAREAGCDLVVFPELSLTGYLLADQVPEIAVPLGDPRLDELRHASVDCDVLVGLVEDAPGHRFHNVAAYFSGGRLVHTHRKLYLPTYGLFQEGREFTAGDRIRHVETSRAPR